MDFGSDLERLGDPCRDRRRDAGECGSAAEMTKDEALQVKCKQLPSGYWHIRGIGPCNWAQPRVWPCSEEHLRSHAFPQASESFLQAVLEKARKAKGAL